MRQRHHSTRYSTPPCPLQYPTVPAAVPHGAPHRSPTVPATVPLQYRSSTVRVHPEANGRFRLKIKSDVGNAHLWEWFTVLKVASPPSFPQHRRHGTAQLSTAAPRPSRRRSRRIRHARTGCKRPGQLDRLGARQPPRGHARHVPARLPQPEHVHAPGDGALAPRSAVPEARVRWPTLTTQRD